LLIDEVFVFDVDFIFVEVRYFLNGIDLPVGFQSPGCVFEVLIPVLCQKSQMNGSFHRKTSG
jgi:hypothetical protein